MMSDMKVFAHYIKDDTTGNEYRWRTLLQIGNSWNIIGSIVMKNPGSSKPLSKIDDEVSLKPLNEFSDKGDWYSFSVDKTMQQIENIFRAYYKQNGDKTLEGVIQVFNLMNVRDPNLEIALLKNKKANCLFSETLKDDLTQLVSPVYLGWGSLGKNPIFKNNAESIFNKVRKELNGQYLNPEFYKNSYCHPLYLMLFGKNKQKCQMILDSFCQSKV